MVLLNLIKVSESLNVVVLLELCLMLLAHADTLVVSFNLESVGGHLGKSLLIHFFMENFFAVLSPVPELIFDKNDQFFHVQVLEIGICFDGNLKARHAIIIKW